MHVLGYLGDAAGATFNPGAPAGHILDLRALVITDSLDEYHDHHLAHQHARQYPHHTPAVA